MSRMATRRNMAWTARRARRCCSPLLLPARRRRSRHRAAPLDASLEKTEADYADWLDAGSAVSTIDSGLTRRVAGRGRSAWSAQLRELTPATRTLAGIRRSRSA